MTKLFLLLLFPLAASAQDFVSNGSFEHCGKQCPDDLSQLGRCIGWSSPSKGTSDFFHKCAGSRLCMVPWNFAGKAEAYDGDAYAGIGEIWDQDAQQCEFLQTQLKGKLEKDHSYCLSFYVRRASISSTWANGFSALLSKERIKIKDMDYLPQALRDQNSFQEASVAEEKNEIWQRVSMVLKAKGDEVFLTLGFSRAQVSDFKMTFKHTRMGSEASIYYYIDDISLVEVPEGEGCKKEEIPVVESRVKVDTVRSVQAQIGEGNSRMESLRFDVNSAELQAT